MARGERKASSPGSSATSGLDAAATGVPIPSSRSGAGDDGTPPALWLRCGARARALIALAALTTLRGVARTSAAASVAPLVALLKVLPVGLKSLCLPYG